MSKTYRMTRRAVLDGLKLALWPGVLFAFTICILALGVRANVSPSSASQLFAIGLWFTAAFCGASALYLILLSLANGAFGYFKLSIEGLDFRFWPRGRIFCQWEAVETIARGTLPTIGPSLLIRRDFATLVIRRTTPGWEIRIANNTLGSAKYYYVSLSDLEGWEDGELLMELRAYAPQLKQAKPTGTYNV